MQSNFKCTTERNSCDVHTVCTSRTRREGDREKHTYNQSGGGVFCGFLVGVFRGGGGGGAGFKHIHVPTLLFILH